MTSGSASWIEHPEWPSDEFYSMRAVNWGVLVDAIKKSIMTNNPQGGTVIKTPNAIAAMIESRTWLIDDSEEIAPAGRFNVYTCSKASMISKHTLKRLLSSLWLRQRKDIARTLRETARRAREGIKAEIRAKQKYKPKHGPAKNWVRIERLCDEAMRVHKKSNMWVGVK